MAMVPQGAQPVGSIGNISNTPAFGANLLPGTPLLPGFGPGAQFSNIRSADGLLDPRFRLQGDQRAIQALRGELTGTENLGVTDQRLQNLDAQLARQASAQAKATPREGGLSGLMNQFGAINQGNTAGIQGAGSALQQDLRTRIQGLTQLPGQETVSLQPQQFNISQALAERDRETRARLQDFSQRAQVFGAAKQGQAILDAGKQRGALGLGVFGL